MIPSYASAWHLNAKMSSVCSSFQWCMWLCNKLNYDIHWSWNTENTALFICYFFIPTLSWMCSCYRYPDVFGFDTSLFEVAVWTWLCWPSHLKERPSHWAQSGQERRERRKGTEKWGKPRWGWIGSVLKSGQQVFSHELPHLGACSMDCLHHVFTAVKALK